jgi:hypothetical protein
MMSARSERMEDTVDAFQVLKALEHEQKLLREFCNLSERQRALFNGENRDILSALLLQRSDLMLELSAVDATLGTWIDQIQGDFRVSSEIITQLGIINDDIVQLATQIVEIDEEAQCRLGWVRERSLGDVSDQFEEESLEIKTRTGTTL